MNIVDRVKHRIGKHPLLRPIKGDNKMKRIARHDLYREIYKAKLNQ